MDDPMDKPSSHYNELLDGDVADLTSFDGSTSFYSPDDSSSEYQPIPENQEQQQSSNDNDASLPNSDMDTTLNDNDPEDVTDLTTPMEKLVPEKANVGDKPLKKDPQSSAEDMTGEKYLDANMDGQLDSTGIDSNGRGLGDNQGLQQEQDLDFGSVTPGHPSPLDPPSDHNLTLSYGTIENSSQQNHHQNNTLTSIGSRYVSELETVDLSSWLVGAILVLICLRLPYMKRLFMKLFKNQESEPSDSPTLPYHAIPTKELD
ncbi:hypothetical protein [Absidia glauca]|uniref:Uncharacterized protein n=1 Tax=Absidia glauca TaxID=4829 RepID=A0A163K221_ABSGL|nr:hypothetical protein [Absidia glauca]